MKQSWFLVGLALVLVACTDRAADSPERVQGTISYYDGPVQITVPDAVTLGETFDVQVTTYGGSCLEHGDTEVEVTGLEAAITPYDFNTTPPSGICNGELIIHTHTAEVRFDEPGRATIRIVGMREGQENLEGVLVTETRTLEVR